MWVVGGRGCGCRGGEGEVAKFEQVVLKYHSGKMQRRSHWWHGRFRSYSLRYEVLTHCGELETADSLTDHALNGTAASIHVTILDMSTCDPTCPESLDSNV